MMTNTFTFLITLTLVPLLSAVSGWAQQIKLGEPELIYTEDEIPSRYDGSLSTLRQNGDIPGRTASGKKRLQCVARAKLDAVTRAAAEHKVTPWHKYRDGKWDIPGLSGTPGEDIIPHVTGGEVSAKSNQRTKSPWVWVDHFISLRRTRFVSCGIATHYPLEPVMKRLRTGILLVAMIVVLAVRKQILGGRRKLAQIQ